MAPLRIAIVGAGPAGIYTAEALTADRERALQIDLFDQLPTPFGLLRYGVAPDHLKVKQIAGRLQQVLDDERVRFIGNVCCGRDVSAQELRARYHAVVYAFGAATDRRLGIPGEDLPGSVSAREFVAWYSGYPDEAMPAGALTHHGAAVVGLGNVALDVARVLARPVAELEHTDMPDDVLEALRGSVVTDIHLIGRGRPVAAKFTTKELREFGEIEGLQVVVDPDDLITTAQEDAILAADRTVAANVAVLRGWAQGVADHSTDAPRRLHFHFGTKPVEILGDTAVTGLRVEHHIERPVQADSDRPEYLDVGLVLRAVGYLGIPMEGVPFVPERGTIPTLDTRVLRDGQVSPGEYAAGWISRGATGVIGTNRADGKAVAQAIVADTATLSALERLDDDIVELLRPRDPELVLLDGWAAIDAAEIALGQATGRARAKINVTDWLLEAARASRQAAAETASAP